MEKISLKISIRVVSNAKKPKILIEDDKSLKVWVNAPAVDGKANKKLVEILAAHYKKPKSSFKIIRGLTSKHKVIETIPD